MSFKVEKVTGTKKSGSVQTETSRYAAASIATTGTYIGSAAKTSGAITRTALRTVPFPRTRCVTAANNVSVASATTAATNVAKAIAANRLWKALSAARAANPVTAPVSARVDV